MRARHAKTGALANTELNTAVHAVRPCTVWGTAAAYLVSCYAAFTAGCGCTAFMPLFNATMPHMSGSTAAPSCLLLWVLCVFWQTYQISRHSPPLCACRRQTCRASCPMHTTSRATWASSWSWCAQSVTARVLMQRGCSSSWTTCSSWLTRVRQRWRTCSTRCAAGAGPAVLLLLGRILVQH